MVITLFVYLLCLVCWLGGMIFFTVFTGPAVFNSLARADAGKVVSAIFPRYYLLGYVAGIIGLILALYFAFVRASRLWWSLAAIALVIALVLTFYAGTIVRPKAESLRGAVTEETPDPAREAEFKQLHRLSVALNGAVIVLNLLALLSTAAALTPYG
jgi:uncharacterized membrane protein